VNSVPFQGLYYRSPALVQNLMISVYSLHLQHDRYGGASRAYVDDLLRRERAPASEIARQQLEALRARALLALERVPAYRDLSGRAGVVRSASRAEEILEVFPILEKEAVRRDPADYVPEGLDRSKLRKGKTSGTTGSPLTLYRTVEGLRRNFAFFARLRRWRNLSHWSRTSTLMGRIPLSADKQVGPFWRVSWTTRNQFLSSYHLSAETIPNYARALVAHRPEQIVCYPSSGYAVARAISQLGLRPRGIRAVFTTAETLTAEQRETMEAAFGCPVADQYGQAEWTIWISQCERGTYHLHPEYGFLEVVDSEGRPVTEGSGRALGTGFINDAMVLMRYDTGDRIAVARDQRCDCGRAFPVIAAIEGRQDDLIVTPDGRLVGRLDPAFKGQYGVVEAQIEQTALDRLEIRVVPDERWDAVAEQELRQGLRERVGPAMTLDITRVAAIPRTSNGKFRAVIGLASPCPEVTTRDARP